MLIRRLSFSLLLIACAAHAQPRVPALTGRVIDQADVLTSSTERALTDLLAVHEQTTSNQVVVLTVPSLEGSSVEQMAEEVFNTWGLGQADLDNGVLVLIAREEREMRIEVGYGLEGDLTDVEAGRIIRDEFVPAFRNGAYDAGTLAGVSAVLGTIEGSYDPPKRSQNEPPLFMRLMFGLMFCLMPLVGFVPSFLVAGDRGGLAFMGLFIVTGAGVVTFSIVGALIVLLLYAVGLFLAELWLRQQEGLAEARAAVREALKENRGRAVTVEVGGITMRLGGITQSSGGSSGGGFGGSSGGGGFSGGGGSSGGGGASGSW